MNTNEKKALYEAPHAELFELPQAQDMLASFSLVLDFDEWQDGDDLDFV